MRSLRQLRHWLQSVALEGLVWGCALVAPRRDRPPAEPNAIFVLRNNDLGDLLVVTPLFEALRRRFPRAKIVAGVGSWNFDVLRHNPHLDEILAIEAPWFNKFVPHQKPWHALGYILGDRAIASLRQRAFDVGIDVLGSGWGSLLLLRAGIPYRLGIKGYAGGHTGVQQAVTYNPYEHVGRSALRFAELLGATELPPCRPQIFLTPAERDRGVAFWQGTGGQGAGKRRILIAPGSGALDKYWPIANYVALARALCELDDLNLALVGGSGDREAGRQIEAAAPTVRNAIGTLSLRETFAAIAEADLVLCNSSMAMHAAAAFGVSTLVLLGEGFPSARQHHAQWGYPGTCRSLGKEPGTCDRITSPADVLTLVRAAIA